ncbi:MAG: PVC-type heme-binding CxxCH protein [Verrucomicrobiota bacterium]
MKPFRYSAPVLMALCAAGAVTWALAVSKPGPGPEFRAGVAEVDISPLKFPVRVNGMFTERMADKVIDPLRAKALALDDGETRLVFCVVDTCMMPRELIDKAKAEASKATGLAVERMMVSATHTHSAPSAMGCLGSRMDPDYAAWLPGKMAEAIAAAVKNLQPAKVGWTAVDDWSHTFNRRWVRRPDKMLNDPFGAPNVRAHMHPGFESPDAVGPSGPVDPQLSLLAVKSADGKPLGLLANYSMHYYGSDLLSSDYFGRFAKHMAAELGAPAGFVGIMSQGTSGDLACMDYGAPKKPEIGYDAYAGEIARGAAAAWRSMEWKDTAALKIAQRLLPLNYRQADEKRLARAREVNDGLNGRLPQNMEEIYSQEAVILHEKQRTELVLQAARVGELGITALPNEVYALTGLKLKARSPFPVTMNIELANGAEGYIPPPEQHALGGYTTWAARTAGLEEEAEPRITTALVSLLEEVAGRPARPVSVSNGAYADLIQKAGPLAYWRLEEMEGTAARDASGRNHAAVFEPGTARFLAGADGRRGFQPHQPPAPNAFSGAVINRAAHFAGGRLKTTLTPGDRYSVELWLWNGLPADARPVTGYVFSRGTGGDAAARGEHLGIGGTFRGADGGGPDISGKLILFNGNEKDQVLAGRTPLALRAWHHVVLVRDGGKVRVHLDGRTVPEIAGEFAHTVPEGGGGAFFGGRNDGMFGLEGKLDEIAVYDRALTPEEIAAHYTASGLTPPVKAVAAAGPPAPLTAPLSPLESMSKIHVRAGYGFELAAAEPLLMDPVAIDWDLAGRMWVVEMPDYPLGMDGKGSPGGRVRVLEDTDGDGRYDKSTLFAEGLNFPNGLLTWRDGVIVTAAPDILFLRDTDGDGRADSKEVLISGLLQGNQQLRANGLRWGLDNWVYCAAGGHHGEYGTGTKFRSHRNGTEVIVGSRDFRFRPDGGELEPQSGPSQFGRNRDDWGHWFGTQNSRPLWYYVLEDQYLRRNPLVAAPDPKHQVVVPLNPPVWPASRQEKRFHSFNEAGHFTSACGGMIYRDTLLFPAGGIHAFTCEPFHNVVQHNILTEEGVSYRSKQDGDADQLDFFTSEDRWCRPVMTRTGPDGALWVVDMYRYMIEHPDWLPAQGKEELLPHYRLGEDKGRIYRVFPVGEKRRAVLNLEKATPAQLVTALDSPNEWQRDKGHMALMWRLPALPETERAAVLGAMREQVTKHLNPLVRVHLMGMLNAVGQLSAEALRALVTDAHPRVREVALRFAEGIADGALVAKVAALTEDPDAKVRLQLALSLGEWSSREKDGTDKKDVENATGGKDLIGEALGRLAVRDYADAYMRGAVLSSAAGHVNALAAAVVRAGEPAYSAFLEPLVTMSLAGGERGALASLLTPVLTAGEDRSFTASQMETWCRFQDLLAKDPERSGRLLSENDVLSAILQRSADLVTAAVGRVDDEAAPAALRIAAARVLIRSPEHRVAALKMQAAWLSPQTPGELQTAAITTLAASGDDSVPATLLTAWPSLPPAARDAAVDALMSREPWAFALAGNQLKDNPVTLDAARLARLLQHSSKRVSGLAATASGSAAAGSRVKVVEQFQSALKLTGAEARGRTVFSRLCIGCHQLDGAGNDIGPNLQSVAGHPPEKLLANILDPNADVQPGFHAYQCQLQDGTELYGLLASETGNSMTFKLVDGSTRAVPRREIKALSGATMSLMPEGLEAAMTPQDMADLIQLLRSGGGSAGPENKVSPGASGPAAAADNSGVRVGAAAVNLKSDDDMPLAGGLLSHYTKEQEGELRAVAVVVEKPGAGKVAMVACDVLWVTRAIVDPALEEIERATGIPAANILVNATHTHHAPGTAPAHGFGWSPKFAEEVRRGIVKSVIDAHARRAPADLYFHLGREQTVGANSRLLLRDGSISWMNPQGEAATRVEPTSPFDPQLPVLDFRAADGSTKALLFNHSTHTIGTRSGRDVRSASFYGLAAQDLEAELGGVVGFVEGASGSTHNIRGVPVPLAIERMKEAVREARAQVVPRPVTRVAALKRPFKYRVRTTDEKTEVADITRYTGNFMKESAPLVQDLFATARRAIMPTAGEERVSWLQVVVIGDVAFVGVPAEYFTALGLDIKKRSPFPNTYIAELANDWIGYLPDRDGHARGGYQTWTGFHSYCEPGTGERAADEALKMLEELARGR